MGPSTKPPQLCPGVGFFGFIVWVLLISRSRSSAARRNVQAEVEAEFEELSGQLFEARQHVHEQQVAFNESEAKR